MVDADPDCSHAECGESFALDGEVPALGSLGGNVATVIDERIGPLRGGRDDHAQPAAGRTSERDGRHRCGDFGGALDDTICGPHGPCPHEASGGTFAAMPPALTSVRWAQTGPSKDLPVATASENPALARLRRGQHRYHGRREAHFRLRVRGSWGPPASSDLHITRPALRRSIGAAHTIGEALTRAQAAPIAQLAPRPNVEKGVAAPSQEQTDRHVSMHQHAAHGQPASNTGGWNGHRTHHRDSD
jgi:hypothetical protein